VGDRDGGKRIRANFLCTYLIWKESVGTWSSPGEREKRGKKANIKTKAIVSGTPYKGLNVVMESGSSKSTEKGGRSKRRWGLCGGGRRRSRDAFYYLKKQPHVSTCGGESRKLGGGERKGSHGAEASRSAFYLLWENVQD